MRSLTTKYARCPTCDERLNIFHRIRKCSISGDLCCTRCIKSERFSKTVVEKVPAEYREKFRFFNVLPLLIVCTLMYVILASAWPSFVGWKTDGPLTNVIIDLVRVIGIWLIVFIVLYPISALLPHLGTWMWFWWLENPENKRKVEEATKQNGDGRYRSENKLYNFKIKTLNWIKVNLIEKNLLYFCSVVLNLLLLVLFFIIKSNPLYASTPLSAFAGVILGLSIILNIIIIWIAAGFYSKKGIDNQKNRIIIEILSWSFVILLPLATILYVLGEIASMDLVDQLSRSMANTLYSSQIILFVFLQADAIILSLFLTRHEPDYNWKENNLLKEQSTIIKNPFLKKIKLAFKTLFIFTIFLLLFISLALSHELLMADFAMVFCVASYYFVFIYFLVIFALFKLVKRRTYFKYTNKYWTLVKVSIFIIIVSFLPTLMTVTYTNNNLEKQFNKVFGPSWQSKLTDQERARLPQISYSLFDQYFGYDIPVNMEYDKIYMYDSPRYVKNRTTDTILSDGTSKYKGVVHAMKFNAHLPATGDLRVEFNDPETINIKYPVVIYVHGIGMDRGAGNANMTSQYIANLGYAVFDMSYGFTGWCEIRKNMDVNEWSGSEDGYDYPDTVKQVANFTKFLSRPEIATYYHADMTKVFFAGRSFGGWMCMNLAWLYNTSFAGEFFSDTMRVKGVIPYYPATDIPGVGSEAWGIGEYLGVLDEGAPFIRGSNNPEDPNYNPEWDYYNVLWQAEHSAPGTLAPVFGIQGTHDYMVPQGATKRIGEYCIANDHTFIGAYYPFGSHGFDALHHSHYGQSILYYMTRFMAMTD